MLPAMVFIFVYFKNKMNIFITHPNEYNEDICPVDLL